MLGHQYPYAPMTYLLYDSHICPHVAFPIKAPLPRGVRTTNTAPSKNTCTTSAPQITNSEKCFYAIVRTKRSCGLSPLRTMSCTVKSWPKSIKYVREGNEQQEGAMLEDVDREENVNFIEQERIYPSTSLLEEAKIIQKATLFTLPSPCSSCLCLVLLHFFRYLCFRSLFL